VDEEILMFNFQVYYSTNERNDYIFCVAFTEKWPYIIKDLCVKILETELVWNIYVNIDYQN